MDFDSMAMRARLSLRRIERLHETLVNLRSRHSASARPLMGLLGTMVSLAPLIPLGRLHKRPFQRTLSQRWLPASFSWDHVIQLGPWFLEVTEQWLNLVWLQTGVPIVFPAHQLELYTDASNHGWGAHVLEHSAAGVWPPRSARGTHQPAGDGSRLHGSPILPGSSERLVSAAVHRQRHCGLFP